MGNWTDRRADDAADTATRRSYHLTEEQKTAFDRDGFLVLPGRIGAPLLERLRAAADRWVDRGKDPDLPHREDYRYADRPSGRVMFRIDYLHAKREKVSLELLGSPAVLGIAESLLGSDPIPTYESMVFKGAGDGAAVPWHQDAVHPRRHRIFNIDIYLDASKPGEGALQVVPGSQQKPWDICSLEDRHGWNVPGAVSVAMSPGDILVHDVMLVHGSAPVIGNALRRTLYYEFRSAEQIKEEGPWDAAWVEARRGLLPLALEAHAHAAPESEQFVWQPPAAQRPALSASDRTALRVVHPTHTPGAFCSAGDVPKPF